MHFCCLSGLNDMYSNNRENISSVTHGISVEVRCFDDISDKLQIKSSQKQTKVKIVLLINM